MKYKYRYKEYPTPTILLIRYFADYKRANYKFKTKNTEGVFNDTIKDNAYTDSKEYKYVNGKLENVFTSDTK